MLELAARPRIGPFILTRDLGPSRLGDRQLALHEADYTSHVVHRVRVPAGEDPARKLAACEAVQGFRHHHALPIELTGADEGQVWFITPYTGDVDGLVTLGALLRAKGGYLSPAEARLAVIQLLEVSRDAHEAGLVHGPLTFDEIQIDRRGSLVVEHYGLARALEPDDLHEAAAKAEVLSIVRIGYQMLTGLTPDAPIIPAGRVVAGLDPVWDDWFETGMVAVDSGGPGFKSAAHAHSAIASRLLQAAGVRRETPVRTVLRRLFAGRR